MKRIHPLCEHEREYMRVRRREAEEVMQPVHKTTVALIGARELQVLNPSNIHYHRHLEHDNNYWIFVRDEDDVVEVTVNRGTLSRA